MDSPSDLPRPSTSHWADDLSIEDLENDQLLEKSENLGRRRTQNQHWSSRPWIWLTEINFIILCLTILTATFGQRAITDTEAIKKTRGYSPVFKTFSPGLTPTILNGSLFNYPPSLFRSDPTPALDAEWSRLSDGGWILIARSDIISLGKDPSTRARASPALLSSMNIDPTSELYFAQIDGFHQLHCLNVLLKHSYWEVYFEPNYGPYDSHNAHELHWTHLSHCIDMLYQNLKCNANADIITSIWMVGQEYPYPDFGIEKKRGDFEGLLGWSHAREMPKELVDEWMKMPENGDFGMVYPAPLELYAAKGVEVPEGYLQDHEVQNRKHWYSSW